VPFTEDNVQDAPQFGFEQRHLSQVVEERGLRDCGMSSSGAPSDSGFLGGRHDQVDHADLATTGRDVPGSTAVAATTRSQGCLDVGIRSQEAGRTGLREYVVPEQDREGFAVGLWALTVAILVAVLAAVAGSQYNALSQLDVFPRIPKEGDLTTGGIIAAALVVTLSGAILGGLAGMCLHRKVDKAGLGH